jgi:hypothetical protein
MRKHRIVIYIYIYRERERESARIKNENKFFNGIQKGIKNKEGKRI